jgi:hypothetical protein
MESDEDEEDGTTTPTPTPKPPRRQGPPRERDVEAAGATVELLYRAVPGMTVLDEDVEEDGRSTYEKRKRLVAALLVACSHLLEDLVQDQDRARAVGQPPRREEAQRQLITWRAEVAQLSSVFLDYCNEVSLREVLAKHHVSDLEEDRARTSPTDALTMVDRLLVELSESRQASARDDEPLPEIDAEAFDLDLPGVISALTAIQIIRRNRARQVGT